MEQAASATTATRADVINASNVPAAAKSEILASAAVKVPNEHKAKSLKICPHFDDHTRWGKMGALTPEQEEALEKFMHAVNPAELAQVKTPSETPSHVALRFLRAQNFKVASALKLFNTHLEWRRAFKIDQKRVKNSKQNIGVDVPKCMRIYPCGVKGMDKCGRPLFIKLYGHIDVKAMEANASPLVCASWETINVEKLKFMCDLHSREVGWHVEDNCVIMDMQGMSWGMFNKYIRNCTAECAKMIEPNYPENLGISIIINAPWYIKGIWKVVKMFLKKRTSGKFRIYGSDYKEKLAKFIDPAYLPVEYGGTGEKGFHSTKEILAGTGTNVLENNRFLEALIPGRASCVEVRRLAETDL